MIFIALTVLPYNRPLAKQNEKEQNAYMKNENLKEYSDEQFRRITGVKRTTFEKMLDILRPKLGEKLSKGRRKPKLTPRRNNYGIS